MSRKTPRRYNIIEPFGFDGVVLTTLLVQCGTLESFCEGAVTVSSTPILKTISNCGQGAFSYSGALLRTHPKCYFFAHFLCIRRFCNEQYRIGGLPALHVVHWRILERPLGPKFLSDVEVTEKSFCRLLPEVLSSPPAAPEMGSKNIFKNTAWTPFIKFDRWTRFLVELDQASTTVSSKEPHAIQEHFRDLQYSFGWLWLHYFVV